ncbi:MAG: hypothetical protein ACLTSZ_10055 [Lachnospiraceae bacterium]
MTPEMPVRRRGDIVIIDGGSTSGVTENGVPYTGEDLQDVIIQ